MLMSAFVISRPEPSIFKIAVLGESNKALHIALDTAIGFSSASHSQAHLAAKHDIAMLSLQA